MGWVGSGREMQFSSGQVGLGHSNCASGSVESINWNQCPPQRGIKDIYRGGLLIKIGSLIAILHCLDGLTL